MALGDHICCGYSLPISLVPKPVGVHDVNVDSCRGTGYLMESVCVLLQSLMLQ